MTREAGDKRAVQRPEGTCEECAWNPIGTERCIKKDRPVNILNGCEDDFKPRIKGKRSEASLNEEFLELISKMMIEADEVVIKKGDFLFSITKNDEQVKVKKKKQ